MRVPLTKGLETLVDDEDYAIVTASGRRWQAWKCGTRNYACHTVTVDGRTTTVFLHSLLLPTPSGFEIDHVNGDGLDNRRANLRLATHQQNQGNLRKTTRPTSSRFKGVSRTATGRWVAFIWLGDRNKNLGTFTTEVAASDAYMAAAVARWGDFARRA